MADKDGDQRLLGSMPNSSHAYDAATEVPLRVSTAGDGSAANGRAAAAGSQDAYNSTSAWTSPPPAVTTWGSDPQHQQQQQSVGGAWPSSSYGHDSYDESSGAWGQLSSSAAPYSSFSTAVPAPQHLQPLPCRGWGVQWVLFAVGWLLWPLWWVGALMWCNAKNRDPREKKAFVANVVMSTISIIVLIVLTTRLTYINEYHPDSAYYCDPFTGLCV